VTAGKLIVLEGIDGSGKTTLARGIADRLRARGREVVSTKEPTDGPIGQRIRALAATSREAISAEEEFRLFHEDRIAHVTELVRPSLAAGAIVVQDRSYFSTIAYQGERGLDRDRLRAISESVAPKPDVLLVVDVPAELALERIEVSRNAKRDDFEKLESLRRIREVFLALPGAIVLDGRAAPEVLLDEALVAIEAHIAKL
jgi:dTMP kinase